MKIFIPTSGKREAQPAYDQLAAAGLDVRLVFANGEHAKRRTGGRASLILRCGPTIGAKREAILRYQNQPFAMIDDDIVIKHYDLPTKSITGAHTGELTRLFEKTLPGLLHSNAPYGGMQPRLFCNGIRPDQYPVKGLGGQLRQILFFNPTKLGNAKFEGATGEDLWMQMQLCMQGLPYFRVTNFIYQEKQDKALPGHWTMGRKAADALKIFKRIPPEFIRPYRMGQGRTGLAVDFRKLCIANMKEQ